jgi:hypothetical protein
MKTSLANSELSSTTAFLLHFCALRMLLVVLIAAGTTAPCLAPKASHALLGPLPFKIRYSV